MLHINNLNKSFFKKGLELKVIENLSLTVSKGEFISIVGPSGSGKSTLLSLIAGLDRPESGQVLHNSKEVTQPHPSRGVVFQNFSLFPWLTVKENIAFGLRIKKISFSDIEKITNKYLSLAGLEDFAAFLPKQLSGGMQQRVAIARTLANGPEILLMDEPFGSLDSQTKQELQQKLAEMGEKENKTILFVTHDIQEAVFLADKICVLSKRPAHVLETFTVPFSKPRTPELRKEPAFFELVWKIQKTIEDR